MALVIVRKALFFFVRVTDFEQRALKVKELTTLKFGNELEIT